MTLNVTLPDPLILKLQTGNKHAKHATLDSSAPGTQQQLAGQPSLDASPTVMWALKARVAHYIKDKRVWCDSFHFGSRLADSCPGRALHGPNCKVRFKLRGLSEIRAARTCTETMRRGEEGFGITTAWFTVFHYGGEVQ